MPWAGGPRRDGSCWLKKKRNGGRLGCVQLLQLVNSLKCFLRDFIMGIQNQTQRRRANAYDLYTQ